MSQNPKPLGMVRWYGLRLLPTAWQMVRHALRARVDKRGVRGPLLVPHYDLSRDGAPFSFVYAADVGDGYAPTHAVARCVVRPPAEGPPPAFVLLGGDLIYPSPTAEESYQARLFRPYQEALRFEGREGGKISIFSLPGNHDWYDGLDSFTEHFCHPGERGPFTIQQTHSYFILKLPKGWWLLGVDTGLDGDIDSEQQRYFFKRVKEIAAPAPGEPAPRIILCAAEPYWTFDALYGVRTAPRLHALEDLITSCGVEIALRLSGDQHHYQRYQSAPEPLAGGAAIVKRLALTAGGGGAFLHPTHAGPCWCRRRDQNGRRVGMWRCLCRSLRTTTQRANDALQTEERGESRDGLRYQANSSYPSMKESAALAGLVPVVKGLFRNPWVMIFIGILYLGWSFLMPAAREDTSIFQLLAASPGAIAALVTLFCSVMFFTDTRCRAFRVTGSFLHSLFHTATPLGLSVLFTPRESLSGMIGFVLAGGVIGGLGFAIYLWGSLHLFGRHGNEVFSWLRSSRYKNFLRIKIETDGHLQVIADGIDDIPSNMNEAPQSTPIETHHFSPAEGWKTEPQRKPS